MKKFYALLFFLVTPFALCAQDSIPEPDSLFWDRIDEVVVRADMIRQSQGRTIVRIANSPLQHLPTMGDILGRLPGLKAGEGGLEVFGRGTPLIFIDGKQVQNFSEVEILRPEDILSVEIDRNPSARYDASATSVINIRTRRGRIEGLGILLANASVLMRRYNNAALTRVNFNQGKLRSYFSYEFSYNNRHDFLQEYEINHLPQYTLRTDLDNDRRYSIYAHQVLAGVGYDFSPKSNLSLQYNLRTRDYRSREDALQTITRPGEATEIDIDYIGKTFSPTHIFNATYTLRPDSARTFTLSADYALYDSDNEQQIVENIATHKLTLSDNASDVFAARAEYTLPVFGGAELLLGARYGHLGVNNRSQFADASAPVNDYDNRTRITDDNLAGYLTLERKYERWGWQAGLRYEGGRYYAKADGAVIRDRWDDHLFPSLGLSWGDLSLNYTNRISRPSIEELNPTRRYYNNLTWTQGNPLLRPTISHNVTLSAPLVKSLSLTIGYTYSKDARMSTGISDLDNPEVTIFQPINIERSEMWELTASYNNRWKWYSLSLYGSAYLPIVEIPFLGELLKRNMLTGYFQMSNDFTIGKNTFASVSGMYSTRGKKLMTDFSSSSNLSLSFSQYLFERKLQLTLSANDLLRDQMTSWRDRYGNVESGQYPKELDTRSVRLTIRYNFNNYNDVYRRRSAGDDELNRL